MCGGETINMGGPLGFVGSLGRGGDACTGCPRLDPALRFADGGAKPSHSEHGGPSGDGAAEAAIGGSDCVICLSEPRDTTVLPCRHMCLCSGCAQQLVSTATRKCPVCRASEDGGGREEAE